MDAFHNWAAVPHVILSVRVAVAISREIYGRSFAGSRQPHRKWDTVGVQSLPLEVPPPVVVRAPRFLVFGPHGRRVVVYFMAVGAQRRIAAAQDAPLLQDQAARTPIPLAAVNFLGHVAVAILDPPLADVLSDGLQREPHP